MVKLNKNDIRYIKDRWLNKEYVCIAMKCNGKFIPFINLDYLVKNQKKGQKEAVDKIREAIWEEQK